MLFTFSLQAVLRALLLPARVCAPPCPSAVLPVSLSTSHGPDASALSARRPTPPAGPCVRLVFPLRGQEFCRRMAAGGPLYVPVPGP